MSSGQVGSKVEEEPPPAWCVATAAVVCVLFLFVVWIYVSRPIKVGDVIQHKLMVTPSGNLIFPDPARKAVVLKVQGNGSVDIRWDTGGYQEGINLAEWEHD